MTDLRQQETPTLTRDALSQFGFEIGDFTYGVPNIWWWGEPATLRVGKFCSFSQDVDIWLGGNHRLDWVTTYPFSHISDWPEAAHIAGHPTTKGNIVIGNDVWVGHKASILSGVTIGDGAAIGGSAVVTQDVPPYAVVAGNPARLIRMRFSDDTVRQLLTVQWWNWDLDRIRDHIPLLMQPDISKFLDACEARK